MSSVPLQADLPGSGHVGGDVSGMTGRQQRAARRQRRNRGVSVLGQPCGHHEYLRWEGRVFGKPGRAINTTGKLAVVGFRPRHQSAPLPCVLRASITRRRVVPVLHHQPGIGSAGIVPWRVWTSTAAFWSSTRMDA